MWGIHALRHSLRRGKIKMGVLNTASCDQHPHSNSPPSRGRESEKRGMHKRRHCFSACRQQPLMSLLRDRCQFVGDQRPLLAAVFAAKNLAAGGAAEDRAGSIGFFQAKGAELMLQARRAGRQLAAPSSCRSLCCDKFCPRRGPPVRLCAKSPGYARRRRRTSCRDFSDSK